MTCETHMKIACFSLFLNSSSHGFYSLLSPWSLSSFFSSILSSVKRLVQSSIFNSCINTFLFSDFIFSCCSFCDVTWNCHSFYSGRKHPFINIISLYKLSGVQLHLHPQYVQGVQEGDNEFNKSAMCKELINFIFKV